MQDLVSVEDQIIDAMPAMIERAGNANLKRALEEHLEITRRQRERLDKAKELLGWMPKYSLDEMMSTAWRWEKRLQEDEQFFSSFQSELN